MDVNTTDIKVANRRNKKLLKEIVLSRVFFKLNLVLGIYSKSYIKNIKY